MQAQGASRYADSRNNSLIITYENQVIGDRFAQNTA